MQTVLSIMFKAFLFWDLNLKHLGITEFPLNGTPPVPRYQSEILFLYILLHFT